MRRETLPPDGSGGSFRLQPRPRAARRDAVASAGSFAGLATPGRERCGCALTGAGRLPNLGAMRWLPAVLVLGFASANVTPAGAQTLGQQAAINTAVPVSALALPNLAFDPSRLHFSMSLAMGSGFGSGTQGLQVASLSYQFQSPM